MQKSILISSALHLLILLLLLISLPFVAKKPIDLPPIISVELIQITDKTNIPFAPKAKNNREDKEKEKKLVSEQAPQRKLKKLNQKQYPCQIKK